MEQSAMAAFMGFRNSLRSSAAYHYVQGGPQQPVIFYITTENGRHGKVELSQSEKGVVHCLKGRKAKERERPVYGAYTITCIDLSSAKTVTLNWRTASCSLRLKKNRAYRIAVSYQEENFKQYFRTQFNNLFLDWKKEPSWHLTKMRNIQLCK